MSRVATQPQTQARTPAPAADRPRCHAREDRKAGLREVDEARLHPRLRPAGLDRGRGRVEGRGRVVGQAERHDAHAPLTRSDAPSPIGPRRPRRGLFVAAHDPVLHAAAAHRFAAGPARPALEAGRRRPGRRRRRRGADAARRRGRHWPAPCLLAALGRLPVPWCLARVGAAVLFVAVFALPLVFFHQGKGRLGRRAGLPLRRRRRNRPGADMARRPPWSLLALVLLATAPLDATLKAAHALHAPGLLVQLTLLSYRYLFLLADELGRLRIALRVARLPQPGRRPQLSHHRRRDGGLAGARLGAGRARRPGHALPRLRRPVPIADRLPTPPSRTWPPL